MPLSKTKRRLLWIAASVFLAAIVAVLAIPLWLPLLVRPIATKIGARYSNLQSGPGGAIRFRDVSLTNGPITFTAETLQTRSPLRWLARPSAGTSQTQPLVEVTNWTLQMQAKPHSEKSTPSTYTNVQRALTVAQAVQRWLPNVRLTNGIIDFHGTQILVSSLVLSNGELRSQLTVPVLKQSADLHLRLVSPDQAILDVRTDPANAQGQFHLAKTDAGLAIDGKLTWRTNEMAMTANFDKESVLPRSAKLVSEDFHLNAAELGLKAYGGITGFLRGSWSEGSFAIEAEGSAQPNPGYTNVPPLQVQIEATGTTNSTSIRNLRVNSPWASLTVSEPLQLYFREADLIRGPAKIDFAIDLEKQHFAPLTGQISGAAEVRPSGKKLPLASFEIAGRDVRIITQTNLPAAAVSAVGSLDWPRLKMEKANAVLEDGSKAELEGSAELASQSIRNGSLKLTAAQQPAWLPPSYHFETLELMARFEGPLTNLFHSGQIESSGLKTPQLQPLLVHATWSGMAMNISNAVASLASETARLDVQAALDLTKPTRQLTLSRLSFETDEQKRYDLKKPVIVQVTPGDHPRISLSSLEWGSETTHVEAEAAAEWPGSGFVRANIDNLNFFEFRRIVPHELQGIAIENFKATSSWTNGPITLAAVLSANVNSNLLEGGTFRLMTTNSTGAANADWISKVFPVKVQAQFSATDHGFSISNFLVSSQSAPTALAQGYLPIVLSPSPRGVDYDFNSNAPFSFFAEIAPTTPLWTLMTERTGVRFTDPALQLKLDGNWQNPEGHLILQVSQVSPTATNGPLPRITDLDLRINVNPSQIELTNLHLKVEDQPIILTAKLPLEKDLLPLLKSRPEVIAERVSASLKMEDASLAPFSAYFTNLLAPQGKLTADVNILPGPQLEGSMLLRNGRTRPLSHLGPIRDISLNLQLKGREIRLQNARGLVGASPVYLEGVLDFSHTNLMSALAAPFELKVTGTNVPLSRTPDAIIRSDVNVTITRTNGAPPLVHGAANLRDSILLIDLGALLGGKVATPERRPPFFSIKTMPFAGYRLAVKVVGTEFLRARTPLFVGVASVNADLSGTLDEPIAVGQVTINSGVVRFPFASFRVQQGYITLSSDNPYRPELSAQAQCTQFGYDLRLEVTGPANAPILQFSSNPPLNSEQILLMVTAGELPRDEMVLSNQQRAQTFAVFLGRDLLQRLGYGDDSEQRLTVYSGEHITEKGTSTYRIEYKLADRWTLIGEYDRFDEFNMGVRWRVHSK